MEIQELAQVEENRIAVKAAVPIHMITTFDTTTDEGEAKAFNASMGGDEKVDDHIGETIDLVDYLVEPVETVDENTGEVTMMPHVVLFATDGTSYEGFSKGLYTSVQRLAAMRDNSGRVINADNPVKIEFAQRRARLGRMNYFKRV